MKASEVFASFLQDQKTAHNNPALLDLYHDGMEIHCNVAVCDGQQCERTSDSGRKTKYYSDGINEWWNVRLDSVERDYIGFNVDRYAESIGLSGWNYASQQTEHVGFDFDAVTGHAPGVGLTEERLGIIREALWNLPYTEVVASTSGNGFHVRVYFENPIQAVESRTAHAAIARCVLQKISAEIGFDLKADVDTAGMILWVWSAKSGPNGFKLIKAATSKLNDRNIQGWQSHKDVISGRIAKVRLPGVAADDDDDQLSEAYRRHRLDEHHRRHIDFLASRGACAWNGDRHMLHTHTQLLKQLHDSEHLLGIYETNSLGTQLGEANCFAIPKENGSWKIYRFGGAQEAATWTQEDGKTFCTFNAVADLATAAKQFKGIEREKGGWLFDSAKIAMQVADAIGVKCEYPEKLMDRQTALQDKNGKLVSKIEAHSNDGHIPGFETQKDWHVQVSDLETVNDENEQINPKLRALVTPNGKPIGLKLLNQLNQWIDYNDSGAKPIIQSWGHSRTEAEKQIGAAKDLPWKKVSIPFGPEYPGSFEWNCDALRLAFDIASTPGPHPHWDKLLNNLGRGLDDAVKVSEWCHSNGILNGSDYLLRWYAFVIRRPFCKLPYLFFWGPPLTGKSSAHECPKLLFQGSDEFHGVVDIKHAIGSPFNGECEGAIIGYVDEHDLSKDKAGANKIKELITQLTLTVHRKQQNPYPAKHTLHFIQTANNPNFCPVEFGDVRKVIVHVAPLAEQIEKEKLHDLLRAEASNFLRTIYDLELPSPSPDDPRLAIPALETKEKRELIESEDSLAGFINECCNLKPNVKIETDDFYNAYLEWCDMASETPLHRGVVGKQLKAVHNITRKSEHSGGRRIYVYPGITLEIGATV